MCVCVCVCVSPPFVTLVEEQACLRLGLVEADDEDDEKYWEGKWVGQVLTTQGMTARRVRMCDDRNG